MQEGFIIHLFQKAIYTTIIVALPALLTSLAVGFLISLFQSATAMQEITLTFVPKIIFTLIALGMTANWMLKNLAEFTQKLFFLFSQL